MTSALRTLLLILSFTSAVRGIDFVTGSEFVAARGWGDESTMPLLWGAASIGTGVYGALAAVLNSPRQAINAGLVGMAVSATFAIQVFEMRMLPLPWPPQDARVVADYLGHSALWLLTAGTAFYRKGVDERRHEILGGGDG